LSVKADAVIISMSSGGCAEVLIAEAGEDLRRTGFLFRILGSSPTGTWRVTLDPQAGAVGGATFFRE
jgi:hypothetical protein